MVIELAIVARAAVVPEALIRAESFVSQKRLNIRGE